MLLNRLFNCIIFAIIHFTILIGQEKNCKEIQENLSTSFQMINQDLDSAAALLKVNFDLIMASKGCDTLIAKYHYILSYLYFRQGKKDQAKIELEISKEKYKLQNNYYNLARVYNMEGVYYKNNDLSEKAVISYDSSIYYYNICKDSIGIYTTYSNIAIIQLENGKYQEALSGLLAILDFYDSHNMLREKSSTALILNELYQHLEDYDNAKRYLSISNMIKKSLGDSVDYAEGLLRMSLIYAESDSFKLMLPYIKEADSLLIRNNDALFQCMMLNNAYGKYYTLMLNFPNAEKYCRKALSIAIGNYSESEIADKKNSLAELLLVSKKCEEASKLYEEILPVVTYDLDFTKYIYLRLSESQLCIGNYKMAYHFLLKANEIRDTLFAADKLEALQDLETKYETEKKEALIETQKLQLKNKNLTIAGILAMLLGITGFSIVLRRKWKQEEEISSMLDSRNQELQLLNSGLEEQLNSSKVKIMEDQPLRITLTNGMKSILELSSIQYFEADNNMVNVILEDNSKRHDWQRLKHFADLLKNSKDFMQVHRSYLIHKKHVTGYKANSVTMSNGVEIPIGITNKEKFHEWIKE